LIEFGILGPLQARRDGAELALGGRKQRAVLALLLLEAGRVVSIDRIAEELYAGDTPVTAVTQVHRQVSELRRALDPAIVETRSPGYLVHAEPEALDLRRFERLCAGADDALEAGDAAGAVAALDEALALWRGDALADLAGEGFAQRPIARLEELRQRALERRVEARLALGQHADVIGELLELTAAEPLRERLRELLMLALYRSGRQVDALEVYRATRTALVEAFGVEPGPGLHHLEQAVLSHDPELTAPSGPARSEPGDAVLAAGRTLEAVRALAALGAPLARRPGHELIAALLLAGDSELSAATAALAADRARSSEPMRVAAFVTDHEPDDVLRLARIYGAGLVLVEAPPGFAQSGPPPDDLVDLLARSPSDVAVVVPGVAGGEGGVMVPFAGGEHDWSALELGAWLATATGAPLRLAGASAGTSRLLADASMAVQRLAGIVAEPVLVGPGPDGLAEATASAAAVVVGFSPRWRQEGLGAARGMLVAPGGPPVLAVHRGPQPGGIAPREAATRFTWSAGD